uniref:hypothetical protein n=1 Tax=Staphylococcus auricularis TaxID=29379 RepID=UPI00384D2832
KIQQLGTPIQFYNNPPTHYLNNFLAQSNLIQKPLIQQINSQTPTQLNPHKLPYIPQQTVTNLLPNHHKHPQLQPTLQHYQFLPTTIPFTFHYKPNNLKTLQKSHSIQQHLHLSKPTQHTLYINPPDIKQFH